MRRILISFIFTISTLVCFSVTRLKTGSIEALRNESKLAISLDAKGIRFNDRLTLDDALDFVKPNEGWYDVCVQKFVNDFNEEAFKNGFMIVSGNQISKCNYELHVRLIDLKRRVLTGEVDVKNIATGENVATFEFMEFGDDNDDYLFGDALEDAGEELGKIFKRAFKVNGIIRY